MNLSYALQRLHEDMLQYSQKSSESFILAWVLLLIFLYPCYKMMAPLIASNKIATILGAIAFIFMWLISTYAVSYGRGLDLFNPGVNFFCVLTFLFVFACVKYIEFAFISMNEYSATGHLSTTAKLLFLIGPGAIVTLAVVLTFWTVYSDILTFDGKNTYSVNVGIEHEKGLSVHITDVEFHSSTSKKSVIEKADQYSYFNRIEESYTPKILIPKDTDGIKLSWYSFTEKKYYSDLFPLPIDKLTKHPDSFRQVSFEFSAIAWIIFKIIPSILPEKINYLEFMIKKNGEVELIQNHRGVAVYTQVKNLEKTESDFHNAHKKYLKLEESKDEE